MALSADPLHRQIDRHIAARAGGSVAGLSDDSEFYRRVRLDLSGEIPTAAEVRTFLKNSAEGKRSKLIDQLLSGDAFAAHWTDRLTVMLLERQNLGKVTDEDWRTFLQKQLKGKPRWDVLARVMLGAAGRGEARPARKFLGSANHHATTENVARLFLGMD